MPIPTSQPIKISSKTQNPVICFYCSIKKKISRLKTKEKLIKLSTINADADFPLILANKIHTDI